MSPRDDALEVLLVVRRRLLDRMADVIIRNRDALLNGSSRTNRPLAANPDLAEISRSLAELDAAIAGLAGLADLSEPPPAGRAPAVGAGSIPAHHDRGELFDRFTHLVAETRFEEASRELARILRMPLDGMITATRFFARAWKADPGLPDRLQRLCAQAAGGGSESECIGALIRSFGFQAVESRRALHALRARGADAPPAIP